MRELVHLFCSSARCFATQMLCTEALLHTPCCASESLNELKYVATLPWQ